MWPIGAQNNSICPHVANYFLDIVFPERINPAMLFEQFDGVFLVIVTRTLFGNLQIFKDVMQVGSAAFHGCKADIGETFK